MDANKLLVLHICCAPDATVPISLLGEEGYHVEGYFYGSNIHPEEEFEKRAAAVKTLCLIKGIQCFIMSYEPQQWFSLTEQFALEPEGGKRCYLCYEIQLRAAAEHAVDKGARCLTTTLTISPHKDPVVINQIGERVSREYGLKWVQKIWRKNDGFRRSVEESKMLGLYRQNYCGCIYSIKSR